MTRATYVKARSVPAEIAWEAAGLRWLIVDGGVDVVEVHEATDDRLVIDRVEEVSPSAEQAEDFGRRLAVTHAAGADGFMSGPPGFSGDGWIGMARLPVADPPHDEWAPAYADLRVQAALRAAHDRGAIDADGVAVVERVCAALHEQDEAVCGPPVAPARLHGDLWSGNVLWSPDGAVLIDPAAHGGHPESDLAMLALFGLPHLARVQAAYAEAAGFDRDWQRRTALHQLHPLLVHAQLFGGGYGAQAVAAARAAMSV